MNLMMMIGEKFCATFVVKCLIPLSFLHFFIMTMTLHANLALQRFSHVFLCMIMHKIFLDTKI